MKAPTTKPDEPSLDVGLWQTLRDTLHRLGFAIVWGW